MSLCQAALSSCHVPQEYDLLIQEGGDGLVTATNSPGVLSFPLFKAAQGCWLTAPGHLHPACESIMFQSLPVFISLYSFILTSVYLKAKWPLFEVAWLWCRCWCSFPAAGVTPAEIDRCGKPVSREYCIACGVNMVHLKICQRELRKYTELFWSLNALAKFVYCQCAAWMETS